MKVFKNIMAITLALSMLLSSFIFVNAQEKSQEIKETMPFDVEAKSAYVIETNSGTVLYKKNENEKIAPASITKIMTLLLVMEAIDKGKMKLEDMVSVSDHASKMGGSQIWLKPGEKMSVNDLLKATAIASSNDASVALGEVIGGTEEGFVKLMNKRAKDLGMKDTNFKNACGLDAEGHLTTAHDIGIMSMELLKYEKITEYTSVWMDSLRGGATELVNTNNLVRFYDGCNGLKTGTTDDAGSCLSASAKRGDMQIISVTLGSSNTAERQKTARTLLDYGFNGFEVAKSSIDPKTIKEIKVIGGQGYTADIYVDMSEKVLVEKGKSGDIKQKVEIASEIKAPVQKDQTVGKITCTLDGKTIKEYPIKVKQGVEKLDFLYSYYLLAKNILKL
jgi:D-alanyl-D-alanine carboxypeptidase (penicillin-binding protein 5/6)